YDPEEMRENEDIFTDTSKPPREKEADVFASELLMPCERLKEYIADINNIEKLSGIFHVSRPAVTLAVANFWKSSDKKRYGKG
ncbi:MAG: ImmA/IrrE family metallo-endopeptidase, partial [Pseudomonadota bacterium]